MLMFFRIFSLCNILILVIIRGLFFTDNKIMTKLIIKQAIKISKDSKTKLNLFR